MKPTSQRWKQIGECRFPWEREALEFVRDGLPDLEPYRAWSNVEFLGLDQSINEVDLLVLGPAGFFVVEIKSMPGCVSGDAGTWTWRLAKRDHTIDNPVYLTNLKAKRLKSLLQRGPAVESREVPYIEPAIFCSAASLTVQLPEEARARVFGRDPEEGKAGSGLPGILAELTRNPSLEVVGSRRRVIDTALARALTRAVDAAGIRPNQRSRRVGDYDLERLVFEGTSSRTGPRFTEVSRTSAAASGSTPSRRADRPVRSRRKRSSGRPGGSSNSSRVPTTPGS